jgi:hypothetical protein
VFGEEEGDFLCVEVWWITRADRGAVMILWWVKAKDGSSRRSIHSQRETRRLCDNRGASVGVEMEYRIVCGTVKETLGGGVEGQAASCSKCESGWQGSKLRLD